MKNLTVTARISLVDCWCCGAEFNIVPSIELLCEHVKIECCVSDFTDYPELIAEIWFNLPVGLDVGHLKSRYSNMAGHSYMSNGCLHCDAIFGRHYEIHARYSEIPVASFQSRMTFGWDALLQGLHKQSH